ncbi:MAG: sensor histidine kinase [Crocinitomicaceae bacterium]
MIGVIDSEHQQVGFYTQDDFNILSTIANMLSVKISTLKKEEEAKQKLNVALKIKSDAVIKLNPLILQQENEKEVLIQEVHHRVKNNMQIIISLLKMQIDNAETDHEKRVFSACVNRLYSFANIHGKLYFQNNVLKIPIKDFIYELGSYLIVSHYNSKKVDLNLDIRINEISLDLGVLLGLLISELISQSISLGFKKEIKSINISLLELSNQIILKYSDTSIGFDPTAKKTNL